MAANARDLITLARAYQNLQGVASIDTLLQTLLTAASDAIQKFCRRDFVNTSYDELYSGNGECRLLLRQYPVISVESVRYHPVTVLKITNTDAANVQARVSVISTGLKLVRVNAARYGIVWRRSAVSGNQWQRLAANGNAMPGRVRKPILRGKAWQRWKGVATVAKKWVTPFHRFHRFPAR